MSCLYLSGCLRTSLSRPVLEPKIFELAALNKRPLYLQVLPYPGERSLGHQYFLLAFPFGRVVSDSVGEIVQKAAYSKLSVAGYTPVVDHQTDGTWAPGTPALEIEILSAQASAYDLLVTRHVSCSAELRAKLVAGDREREIHGNADADRYESFAFEKELSLCFSQAVERALDTVLDDLRIYPRP